MNGTTKSIYLFSLIVVTIVTILCAAVQTYRLGETRRQLNDVRIQLAAASDKQQQLREIIRGTDEILNETFTTVTGIRSQIAAIRESYEEMEELLYDSNPSDSDDNNYVYIRGI